MKTKKGWMVWFGALLAIALLAGIGTVAAPGQPQVNPAELDKLVKYMQSTRADVEKASANLTTEQWNWKQAPDRWSIAECVEHLAASEDFLMNIVTERVMKSPARTEPADLPELDQWVIATISDRTNKAQAPEPLKPTNRFTSPQDALKHFIAAREKSIQYAKATPDLRAHAMAFSAGGKSLDGYQWLLFLSAHSERHTKQMREVLADPNFPKK